MCCPVMPFKCIYIYLNSLYSVYVSLSPLIQLFLSSSYLIIMISFCFQLFSSKQQFIENNLFLVALVVYFFLASPLSRCPLPYLALYFCLIVMMSFCFQLSSPCRQQANTWLSTGWFTMLAAVDICNEITVYGMADDDYCTSTRQQ